MAARYRQESMDVMRGIVFLSSQMVLRFLKSGAFDDLDQQHDLIYALLKETQENPQQYQEMGLGPFLAERADRVVWLFNDVTRFPVWRELFDISAFLHEDISSSFALKNRRLRYQSPDRARELDRLAHSQDYATLRLAREAQLGYHPEIVGVLRRFRPDYAVLPSGGIDFMADDVLQACEAFGVPVFMPIANWDNLTSKGILFRRPAMMGVWGEQTREHAIRVQKMPPEDVRVIGAPQYPHDLSDPPFDPVAYRAILGLPPEGRILLFTGALRAFDETEVLQTIERAIDDGTLPADWHVLYRPHPWRQKRQHEANFFDQTWQHVTLDPGVAQGYRLSKGMAQQKGLFMFEMDHLFKVYRLVDAQISVMSTVLIEGMMYGLPTMGLAYNDGKNLSSMEEFSDPEHFKELFDLDEIILCEEKAQFMACLQRMLARVGDPGHPDTLREASRFFIYQTPAQTYGQRLTAAVQAMLDRPREAPNFEALPRAARWRNAAPFMLRSLPVKLKRRLRG